MARPTLISTLNTGVEGWNDIFTDDFDILLSEPWPVYQKTTSDESTLTATFPPASYDRCILFVNHSTLGWIMYYSNGTTWLLMPKQGTAVTALTDNSTGTSGGNTIAAVSSVATAADAIATLAAKLNELRTALRAGGIIA